MLRKIFTLKMAMMAILGTALIMWSFSPAMAQGMTSGKTMAKSTKMSHMKSGSHKGILDGKYFSGTETGNGTRANETDEVYFRDGMLHSKSADMKSFEPAPYTATEENGTISFKAETMSKMNGKMEWNGTVKDNKLDATVTWTRNGKEPTTLTINCSESQHYKGEKMAPAPTMKK
ncbi:exported hypothetical protein [Candidatus Zixiibacteriota bacterium]|nr:exported hypothetical protein [candidate division Zixibacteria bacterium]